MTSSPRVALVHDFLSQHGGAERVVLRFAAMFPDAPIFTAFYDRDGTYPAFRLLDVRPSALQDRVDPGSFRRQVLRYPRAFRSFDLREFDAVLVSSSGFAHHVRHPRTLVYCHTPPRYLYAPHTYVNGRARGVAHALGPALAPLRRADRRAARAAASYVGNSERTAQRVRHRYGIECGTIAPPIATGHLPARPLPLPERPAALVISRLLPYKRVDLAVVACRRLGVPLTVVGEGPDRERLETLAGPATTFAGRVSDGELRGLMAGASVVLVPGAEDFGLIPLEANWSGRPVIAFAHGGPRETVTDGVNGLLVEDHETGSWVAALRRAVDASWDPHALRAATAAYAPERFEASIRSWMTTVTGLPVAPQPELLDLDAGGRPLVATDGLEVAS